MHLAKVKKTSAMVDSAIHHLFHSLFLFGCDLVSAQKLRTSVSCLAACLSNHLVVRKCEVSTIVARTGPNTCQAAPKDSNEANYCEKDCSSQKCRKQTTPIMHESTRALNGSYSKINRLDGFGRKHLEART